MGLPGVGFQELVIILVAALLIFGPNKLPEVMGQAGRAVRDFRKMTGNLQEEFEKNINDAAGTDVRKTLSSEISNLKGEVQGATNAVTGKTPARTSAAKTTPSTARASTTGTKPATSSAAKSSSTSTTSTAAKKIGSSSVVGAGSTKTATVAAPAAENGTGEIEFAPVLTTTRRRGTAGSASATIPASKPSTPAPASATAVAEPAAAAEIDQSDPFARARSRRQTAGYQR